MTQQERYSTCESVAAGTTSDPVFRALKHSLNHVGDMDALIAWIAFRK